MHKFSKYIISFILLFSLFFPRVLADTEKNLVNIHIFYSNTCPHCTKERKLLGDLKKEYKNLRVYEYETSLNDNNKLYRSVANMFKLNITTVPFTIIGDAYFTGYNEPQSERKIRSVIEYYSENGYQDKVGELVGDIDLPTYEIKEEVDIFKYLEELDSKVIDIPLVGEVNTKDIALPLVTIIMGLLDGFNPCAMWVLLFLISMLLGMKDKKRMWILGLAFIITSSVIYYLFMVSWLNLTNLLTGIATLRIIIALVALVGGSYNLYSYIKTRKESGCNVIDDKKRNKMFTKIKRFTTEKSFALALFGIITLAISVNVVELACSAGLPVMYIEILHINGLTNLEYYIYILLYVLFFMLDDIIVFIIAMVSMQLTGLSTKYGKLTKLIGGLLLIAIGLLMMFKPEWLMFNFN